MSFLNAHKNDVLLVLAVLILAGSVWIYTLCTRSAGGEAVVTVDGEVVAKLPLKNDILLHLEEGSGFDPGSGFQNTVEVASGQVRVIDANCPDKICEHTGWVRYDGQMIVCLPHKLIVTVAGGEAGADAMAQ